MQIVSATLTYDENIEQWGAWVPDVAAYGVGDSPQDAMLDLQKAQRLFVEYSTKN